MVILCLLFELIILQPIVTLKVNKCGKKSLVAVASFCGLDMVITDKKLFQTYAAKINTAGVELIKVSVFSFQFSIFCIFLCSQ
jgi:hypothetical protein